MAETMYLFYLWIVQVWQEHMGVGALGTIFPWKIAGEDLFADFSSLCLVVAVFDLFPDSSFMANHFSVCVIPSYFYVT